MNGLDKGGEAGVTPLGEDDVAGLIPEHVTTQEQLNEWEQENILEAQLWISRARLPALDDATIRELHRRMFNRTWRWAGHYRRSDTSLGSHWPQIAVEVRDLVENARYWTEHGTFPTRETAARLHHQLVRIHPFPNGNGRHGRLWADMLLLQRAEHPFDWRGAGNRQPSDPDRTAYIRGLRRADDGDYSELFNFLGVYA